MPSVIDDFKALQLRCSELGIVDLKGDVIMPPKCHIKSGLPIDKCVCHRGDGTYTTCHRTES